MPRLTAEEYAERDTAQREAREEKNTMKRVERMISTFIDRFKQTSDEQIAQRVDEIRDAIGRILELTQNRLGSNASWAKNGEVKAYPGNYQLLKALKVIQSRLEEIGKEKAKISQKDLVRCKARCSEIKSGVRTTKEEAIRHLKDQDIGKAIIAHLDKTDEPNSVYFKLMLQLAYLRSTGDDEYYSANRLLTMIGRSADVHASRSSMIPTMTRLIKAVNRTASAQGLPTIKLEKDLIRGARRSQRTQVCRLSLV